MSNPFASRISFECDTMKYFRAVIMRASIETGIIVSRSPRKASHYDSRGFPANVDRLKLGLNGNERCIRTGSI